MSTTTHDTRDGREIADVVVTSFGYGHSPAPEADLTLDARRHLRNPHHDPAMRTLTGLDRVVREHVLATPGAQATITTAITFARDLHAQVNGQRLVTIAVGCVGGRHRSVAIAAEVVAGLNACGLDALVAHRDVGRPVIQT
ncbi:RNase adapter RapZ [Streptosporangium sp. NPDC049248]|uniref:RapZ C-terminal domain-containing protein n=1 Tax=Streptosporangium sp. NPDC049248 TaxID=3155651 RepID=UPI003438F5A0